MSTNIEEKLADAEVQARQEGRGKARCRFKHLKYRKLAVEQSDALGPLVVSVQVMELREKWRRIATAKTLNEWEFELDG